MNLQTKKFAAKTAALLASLLIFTNCGPNDDHFALQNEGSPTGEEETVQGKSLSTKIKHFRLMIKDDPSSSIVIGYSSATRSSGMYNPVYYSSPLRTTKVYIDTKDHGLDVEKYATVLKPTTTNEYMGLFNYFVDVKNLRPSTKYYFVVSDGSRTSKRYWFKTASNSNNTKLSIVSGGDTRTNRTPRQEGMKLVAKLRPDFVMFQGDHTTSNSDGQWEEWFKDWQLTVAEDGRMTPAIFTRGNHESTNSDIEQLFLTPKGVYYGVTFGGDLLRVYTLNSESGVAGNQTTWLKNDLAANSFVEWKFAQYHSPIRPHTSGKKEATTQYQNWAPLFYSGRMNVVSEADAHTVKRTYPVRPSGSGEDGFTRDDAEGTVYIGEGCWGAPLRANNNLREWTRDSGRFNSFNWIFVDKSKVEIRTVVIETAAKVASLTDSNRFVVPAGLNIFNPPAGAVQTLRAR